jgi:hypothetical protein
MTPENFCYWLQGLLEIGNPEELSKNQIEIIQEHLDLTLNKSTPTHIKKLDLDDLKKLYEPKITTLPFRPLEVTC